MINAPGLPLYCVVRNVTDVRHKNYVLEQLVFLHAHSTAYLDTMLECVDIRIVNMLMIFRVLTTWPSEHLVGKHCEDARIMTIL